MSVETTSLVHNQSLQQTLDPVAILAAAKPAPASIAAEPRRQAELEAVTLLGVLSLVPLLLMLLVGAFEQFSLAPMAIAGLAISYAVSIAFLVLGRRRGFPMMSVWLLAFLLLPPFANIAFALANRTR